MESMLFLLMIFMLGIFDVFLITMQRSEAYLFFFWLKLIPVALIIAALGRLWKRQKTFNACISALTHVSRNNQAQAIVYRLTDQEITTFAEMTSQQIEDYAASQKELRWQVIKAAYFKPHLPPINGSDSNSFPLEARKNTGAIFSNIAPVFSEPMCELRERK